LNKQIAFIAATMSGNEGYLEKDILRIW